MSNLRQRQCDIQQVNAISATVEETGLSWDELVDGSQEIVLFGSHAMGQSSGNSDVDIFIAGGSKRRKRSRIKNLDLVWIESAELSSLKWLQAELALHIKTYGLWIKGDGQWTKSVRLGDHLWEKKNERIKSRAIAVLGNSSFLTQQQIEYHLKKIRRDMQRSVILRERLPCPCSSILDEAWITRSNQSEWMRRELDGIGLPMIDVSLLSELFLFHGFP